MSEIFDKAVGDERRLVVGRDSNSGLASGRRSDDGIEQVDHAAKNFGLGLNTRYLKFTEIEDIDNIFTFSLTVGCNNPSDICAAPGSERITGLPTDLRNEDRGQKIVDKLGFRVLFRAFSTGRLNSVGKEIDMRRSGFVIFALAAILIFGAVSSEALTGLGFGLRVGTIKLEDPNTDESLDAMTMFGGHVKVGTLPIIDFEGSLEYAQKKYDIDIPIPGAEDIVGDVTFRNVSLRAAAKYNVSPPLSPIKPYVGASLGMHFLTSTIDVPGTEYTIPLNEDYSESKTGMDALGGLLVSLPLFPVEFFAEGRYGVIFADGGSLKSTSIYAGATLKLP